MASKTLVPVEEYLKMSFEGPEPEYVDGEIVGRRLGSTPHFKAQGRMLEFFRPLRQSHSLYGYSEVTLRISPTRYRVADVAVFAGDIPTEKKYPTEPPEFVVEIVSEDDRYVEIKEELAEYHVWELGMFGSPTRGHAQSRFTTTTASTRSLPLSYPSMV